MHIIIWGNVCNICKSIITTTTFISATLTTRHACPMIVLPTSVWRGGGPLLPYMQWNLLKQPNFENYLHYYFIYIYILVFLTLLTVKLQTPKLIWAHEPMLTMYSSLDCYHQFDQQLFPKFEAFRASPTKLSN